MRLALILLSIFSQNVFAGDCRYYSVKSTYLGEVKIHKKEICKSLISDTTFFTTKNCKIVNGNVRCLTEQMKKYLKNSLESSHKLGKGSPGFNLCKKINGTPQIISIEKDTTNWEEISVCYIGNEDFLETSLLSKNLK